MAVDLTTGTLAAFLNAISGLTGVAIPLVDDAVAQKYETQLTNSIKEWNNLVANWNPDNVNTFVMQLIGDAGQTIGSMGDNKSVPLGVVSALVTIAIEEVFKSHVLAAMLAKQNSSTSS